MLKIRMQRTGRINQPSYRIIVTEHTRSPKTGNFVEKVGTYNPRTKERTIDADRVKYWLSVGAQASGTMHNMLITTGIIMGKKVNVLPKKTVAKVEEPVVETPAAEAAASPQEVPETPTESPAETPTPEPTPETAEAPAETPAKDQ